MFTSLLVTVGLNAICPAQSLFQWTTPNDSFYDIGSNWTPTGPPSSIDAAQFLQNSTYEVRWDNLTATVTPDVGFVDVGTGNVTFQNLETTQHSFTINNDLTLFDGALFTNSGLNLHVAGSTFIINDATLFIDGSDPAGSQFNANGQILMPFGKMTFDNGASGILDNLQLNVDAVGPATLNVLGGSNVAVDRLRISDGASQPAGCIGMVNVSGSNSTLNLIDPINVFLGDDNVGLQTINVSDGGKMLFDDEAIVGFEQRTEVIVSNGFLGNEFLNLNDDLSLRISGTLLVQNGGQVASTTGSVLFGNATISGVGSIWQADSFFSVRLGEIIIESGGQLITDNASIGFVVSSAGSVATVQGNGSNWTIDGLLDIGEDDDGELHILSGGTVTNAGGIIGTSAGANGIVNVVGNGSCWDNSFLVVGQFGQGTLNIDDGGLVTSTITQINAQSAVNLDGGRFEFGSMNYDELTRVTATGGSMAGTVDISGVNDVASLGPLQNPFVDLSEVAIANSGLLHGSAILHCSLNNELGELRTQSSDWTRFEGIGNINSSEINNFGGTVDFAQDITNQMDGFIGGRGLFVADGGWLNAGVMAFSGTTDILGDVENLPGGQIVSSGGIITTFFDDVVHNGTEIRTSDGSATVIFGQLSGGGAFTGTGTVYLEGDLRPGNSPDTVTFEGDVVLGSAASSVFELAGTDVELFDQILIAGDLTLDGSLTVELIDGFQLAANQQFLIGDIDGNLSGQFDGLGEGSLVGTFGGVELFISYAGGDGNDVVLTTVNPNVLLGDVNLDGSVNLLDVDPFIELLASGQYQAEADINQDGAVNLLDVGPFIDILAGG